MEWIRLQLSSVLFGIHWLAMLKALNNFGTFLHCRFRCSSVLNKLYSLPQIQPHSQISSSFPSLQVYYIQNMVLSFSSQRIYLLIKLIFFFYCPLSQNTLLSKQFCNVSLPYQCPINILFRLLLMKITFFKAICW